MDKTRDVIIMAARGARLGSDECGRCLECGCYFLAAALCVSVLRLIACISSRSRSCSVRSKRLDAPEEDEGEATAAAMAWSRRLESAAWRCFADAFDVDEEAGATGGVAATSCTISSRTWMLPVELHCQP